MFLFWFISKLSWSGLQGKTLKDDEMINIYECCAFPVQNHPTIEEMSFVNPFNQPLKKLTIIVKKSCWHHHITQDDLISLWSQWNSLPFFKSAKKCTIIPIHFRKVMKLKEKLSQCVFPSFILCSWSSSPPPWWSYRGRFLLGKIESHWMKPSPS